MSRRAVKQQKKEDFLDANPQLFRSETRIEVGRAEENNPHENIQLQPLTTLKTKLSPYEAQVTIDGEPEFAFTGIVDYDENQTLAQFIDFQTGTLNAGNPFGPVNIQSYSLMSDLLSLTENGFGVAQYDDYMYYQYMESMLPMAPSGNDAALDGDERIFFDLFGFGPSKEIEAFIPLGEEMHEPAYELGGKEFGIDFKVLGGAGTVQIVLIDFDDPDADPVIVEMNAGGRRPSSRVDEGHLEAGMDADSAYDAAYIAVTGNLEISVVGIDISTNFEAMDLMSA